jgi:hypothetical protein
VSFEEWLALREPADAAARSRELVERLEQHLAPGGRHVIHDLGCGTGSMGRWLAPQLAGPQHWVLHDRDADLLRIADVPGVTLEKRQSDITRLQPADLAGASLVTASALLDLLAADELHALVALVAGAGCPALLTLSVAGRVDLQPADPLDQRIAAAFNAHQRRTLLGPDAPAAAALQFARRGAEVVTRPSPWRLGPDHAELAAEWLAGWVGAACEQDPGLRAEADGYMRRRNPVAVSVDHMDLLAIPAQSVANRGESA